MSTVGPGGQTAGKQYYPKLGPEYVLFLSDVDDYVGGAPNDLDSVHVGLGDIGRMVQIHVAQTGKVETFELKAGTLDNDVPGIVRPLTYEAGVTEIYWERIAEKGDIEWNPDVDVLTGGGGTALDAVPTVERELGDVVFIAPGLELQFWQLVVEDGTPEDGINVVWPDDHSDPDNKKMWVRRPVNDVYVDAIDLGVPNPQGIVVATYPALGIGSDGTWWVKTSGVADTDGWRQGLLLDENGNIDLPIEFTEDNDPNTSTGILTFVNGQLHVADPDNPRQGRMQDGWDRRSIKFEDTAVILPQSRQLVGTSRDYFIPASLIDALESGGNLDKVEIQVDVRSEFSSVLSTMLLPDDSLTPDVSGLFVAAWTNATWPARPGEVNGRPCYVSVDAVDPFIFGAFVSCKNGATVHWNGVDRWLLSKYDAGGAVTHTWEAVEDVAHPIMVAAWVPATGAPTGSPDFEDSRHWCDARPESFGLPYVTGGSIYTEDTVLSGTDFCSLGIQWADADGAYDPDLTTLVAIAGARNNLATHVKAFLTISRGGGFTAPYSLPRRTNISHHRRGRTVGPFNHEEKEFEFRSPSAGLSPPSVTPDDTKGIKFRIVAFITQNVSRPQDFTVADCWFGADGQISYAGYPSNQLDGGGGFTVTGAKAALDLDTRVSVREALTVKS